MTKKSLEIKHVVTQRYGGYITYFKLVFSSSFVDTFIKKTYRLYCLNKIGLLRLIYFYFIVLIKSVYWLLIKPLGFLIVKKIKKSGIILQGWGGNVLISVKQSNPLIKTTYRLFGVIPFFHYRRYKYTPQEIVDFLTNTKMSTKEKKELKKQVVGLMVGNKTKNKLNKLYNKH